MVLRTLKCYVGLTWQDKFGDDGLVKLSVLDYALIDEGKDAQKALQDSVTLAKLADRLGFKRIWFTEHHNVPAFACSSPELFDDAYIGADKSHTSWLWWCDAAALSTL